MSAPEPTRPAYLVVDGHNDLPYALRELCDYDLDAIDLVGGTAQTQTDFPRLAAGGVGGQFWSVYVPSNLPGREAVAQTLEQVDCVRALCERFPDRLALTTSADELEATLGTGRIASLMGAEGGQSIGESLAVLRVLFGLGVRYMTLTHNDNTPWAGSATDAPLPGGLTDFGREVVREMNRLGMMVDLSHVAPNTMHAALDTTSAPVIFSHSSARSVTDVVRNVPDDVLARMAAGGGTCMVTFVPEFINADVAAWREETRAAATAAGADPNDWPRYMAFCEQRKLTHPKPDAPLADVVAHVERVREVAGIDHIGLGGDYDGTDTFPVGMPDVSGYPVLFEALRERHWSRQDLEKLAHRNIIATMHAIEDCAQRR